MRRRNFLTTSLTFASFLTFANGTIEIIKIKISAVCGMCQDRIEEKFKTVNGVTSATLELETNILTITFDSKKISVAELKSTLTKLGYDANGYKAIKESFDKLPHCCKKD